MFISGRMTKICSMKMMRRRSFMKYAGETICIRLSVKEGKIELVADIDGLLKVDDAKMRLINGMGQLMIASRHGNFAVHKGDKLAGTRIIPLVIEKEKMERAREMCGAEPILKLLPFVHKKVGIVTTGSEVYHHRIKDEFTPVIYEKLAEFDTEVIGQISAMMTMR